MNSRPNTKIQRINSDILRTLSVAVRQKTGDASLQDVTILRVETAADLSEAKVYVNTGVAALERASGFLRNEIAQSVKMKQTPRLRFIIDKGPENAARVEQLLAQINSVPHTCGNCCASCKNRKG